MSSHEKSLDGCEIHHCMNPYKFSFTRLRWHNSLACHLQKLEFFFLSLCTDDYLGFVIVVAVDDTEFIMRFIRFMWCLFISVHEIYFHLRLSCLFYIIYGLKFDYNYCKNLFRHACVYLLKKEGGSVTFSMWFLLGFYGKFDTRKYRI